MADNKESRGASQMKRRLAGRKSSGIRGGSTAVLVGGLAILACAAVRWIVKRRKAAKQITRNSEQVENKVDEICCNPSSPVVVSNGIPDLGFERKDQSSNAGICVGNGALEDTSQAGKFVVSKELGTPDAAKVVKLGSEENDKDHNSSGETNVDQINGVLEGVEGSTCGHEHEEVIPTPPQDDHHAPVFDEKLGEEHAQVDLDNALPPREELTSSIQTELILENKELTPLLEMSQIAQEVASLLTDASSIEGSDADSKPEHEVAKGLSGSVAVYVDKEQVNDLMQEVSIKQVISCYSSDCMKDSVKKQVELCDCVVNYEVREQKTCEEPVEGELEVAAAVLMNKPEADNLVDKVNELKTRQQLHPKVTAAAVINQTKAADGLTFLHAEIVQLSTDHKSRFTSETVKCSTDESKQAVTMEQKQQIDVHGPAEDMEKNAAEITLVPSVDKVKPAEEFKLKLESLTNTQELAQFAATPAQALKKVIKALEILKKTEQQHKGVRHRPWKEDLWQMVPVAMEVAIMFLIIGFIFMLLKHLPGLPSSGYPSD